MDFNKFAKNCVTSAYHVSASGQFLESAMRLICYCFANMSCYGGDIEQQKKLIYGVPDFTIFLSPD